MAIQTVDLPAYGCIAPYGGTRLDNLSTPDTSSEITISDIFQDIAVGTYGGGGYNPAANVDLSAVPAGATVTDVRYVMIAYRESASAITSDPGTGYTPTPTSQPFLYLSSGARTSRFTFDSLPVGGYAGEVVSDGVESFAQLQLDHPLNKVWFSTDTSSGPTIHVAYLAIRVTYEDNLSPCYQTLNARDPFNLAGGDSAGDPATLWGDGSDATYAVLSSATPGGDLRGVLDAYTGRPVVDLGFDFRASVTGTASRFLGAILYADGIGEIASTAGPTLTADGVSRDYSHTFTPDEMAVPFDAVRDMLAGGAGRIEFSVAAGDLTVTLQEVSVRVGHKCVVPLNPLRIHPRSSTRIYPRRRTRQPGTF